MSNDRQVIAYMSPADLVALMNATGVITVHESGTSDGKPVIHASVKVVNADTGEQLPGGLPFSVVMFKGLNEPAYSNIAIGTIVPASELKLSLPRDYFNFCNQRFRFTRVFPVDDSAFVIQMDLVLKNATREYVKFSFGLWGALFSQMLFELMGRGQKSLIAAAEAYAQVHTDFAAQIATTPETAEVMPVPMDVPVEPEAVLPLDAGAIVPPEAEAVALDAEAPVEAEPSPVEPLPVEEATVADAVVEDAPAEAAEPVADAVAEEVADPAAEVAVETSEPELSIAAGPAAVEVADVVEVVASVAPEGEPAELPPSAEIAEAKDVMPA